MSQPVNMPAPHGDSRFKCGTCKWYVQGFEGKTCQVTRKVADTTRACIEYQPYKAQAFDAIDKDKFLIEMRKTLRVWTDDAIKKFDVELKSYRLFTTDTTMKDPMSYMDEGRMAEFAQKFETCQHYLDRLIDLRFTIQDKAVELHSFSEEVQSYIFTNYRDHVQALKNESERKAFYRSSAPELFRALDKMESLKDKALMAYENLKNTHFAMARKQDAILELYKAKVHSLESRNRTSG